MADTKKRQLKPIELCPNGHYYDTSATGEICDMCGAKLDPPEDMSDEDIKEFTHVEERDRVCGWLVCIEGPNVGRGYEIRDGKNFVGRASSMHIQILGDKKIEKKNHMVIAYDSKDKKTTILPGESQGMVYWQGKAIFAAQDLAAKNKIEIGDSVFKFIPFCDKDFDWSMLKDK